MRYFAPLPGMTPAYPPSDLIVGAPDRKRLGLRREYGDMRLCYEIEEMREHCKNYRWTTPPSRLNRRYALGFVPTMGAIHEAHLALVEASQAECVFTVVSIFVNPAQFAAHEDLDKYPRPIEKDLELLQEAGVDGVWLPTREQMYPEGFISYVDPEGIVSRPEASSRPHFFRGVATICTKLFTIVNPNRVYVGQKDAVQCAVLKALVRDLNMETEVVVCPTVRELDGLAHSSRNVYLSAEEREQATVLYRALSAARDHYNLQEREAHEEGNPDAAAKPESLKGIVETIFKSSPADLLYVSVGHPRTMAELPDGQIVPKGSILSCAATLGKTRLLDCVRLGYDENDYW
eukprot:TRINITY_DN14976_c0_g1_i1.p1 TRINITY_DN14976_c0_g1~~TRINITY_DN14976_c0_g1_i1.p1  ORF type:complete len:388 (+),score=93.89 TRINITY_DN14976_c0_g1_i1:126-1166(+)